MLSDETARLLEFIASFDDGVPQNRFPDWARWRDIDDLERRGLISFSTLLPPNKEPEHPRGLYAAHITTAGRDALFEKQRADNKLIEDAANKRSDEARQTKERKLDFRRSLFIAVISSIASTALALFVEHVLFK